MQDMQRELAKQIVQPLMMEYTSLLTELFPGCVVLDDLIEGFNQKLPKYQGVKKSKLDPEAIRKDRAISCSSTAGLIGIWWENNMGFTPVYFIQRHVKTQDAHVIVALPHSSAVTVAQITRAYEDMRHEVSHDVAVQFADYTHERHVGKKSGTAEDWMPEGIPLTTTESMLVSRLTALDLRRSTINRLLGLSTQLERSGHAQ